MLYIFFSYIVASVSDITPCVKVDKPLLVYRCIDGSNNVAYIWQKLSAFTQFQSSFMVI